MKHLAGNLAIFVLCLGLAAWAQDKTNPNNNQPAPDGIAVVDLTDGGVSVSIDSFGRAGQPTPACAAIGSGFQIDEPNTFVLCEHTDFISAGGRVMKIISPTCTVVNAITADASNHATSTVQCGDCTIDFDQLVDDSTKAWYTTVSISGCTPACYYAYTDYDVHGFADNGASLQYGEAGFLGQFVVRNNTLLPDVHYLLTDQYGAVHFAQGEYPSIRIALEGYQSCQDLADAPEIFNGDFTGALQWSFGGEGVTGYVVYSHGRDDTTKFP